MTEEKNEESIVLNSEKDKVTFLKDCLKEINRINKSIGKVKVDFISDQRKVTYFKKDDQITTQIPYQLKIEIENVEAINSNLSSSEFTEEQKAGLCKVVILAAIYNQVAVEIAGQDVKEPVNLTEIFKKHKSELSKQNIDIHETMSAHRKPNLKNPQNLFHRFLAWLMPPKSKQFLEKYEFFKATADEKKSDDDLENNKRSTSSRRDGY